MWNFLRDIKEKDNKKEGDRRYAETENSGFTVPSSIRNEVKMSVE